MGESWKNANIPKKKPLISYENGVFLKVKPVGNGKGQDVLDDWKARRFPGMFASPSADGVKAVMDCFGGILKAADALHATVQKGNNKDFVNIATSLPGLEPASTADLFVMGVDKLLEFVEHYKEIKESTNKTAKKTPEQMAEEATEALINHYRQQKDVTVGAWATEVMHMADSAMLHIWLEGTGKKTNADKIPDLMRIPLVNYVDSVRARLYYYSQSKTKLKDLYPH